MRRVRVPAATRLPHPGEKKSLAQGRAPLTTKSASRSPHSVQHSRRDQVRTVGLRAMLLDQLGGVGLKPMLARPAPHDEAPWPRLPRQASGAAIAATPSAAGRALAGLP